MSYHSIVELFDKQDLPTVSARLSVEAKCSSLSLRTRRAEFSIMSEVPELFDQIAEHATQCASFLRERAAVTVPCNPPVEAEEDNGVG